MRGAGRTVLFMATLAGCSLFVDLDSVRPDDLATDAANDAVAGLAVSVAPSVRVRAGAMTSIEVSISRGPGIAAIDIEASGLPAGATVPAIQIPVGETTGTLQVSASGATAQGDHAIAIVARATGAPDAQAVTTLIVAGDPGTLDLSFGVGGIMTSPAATAVTDVGVTASGRIFVLATVGTQTRLFALRRDGGLDPGFDTDGVADVDLAGDAVMVRGEGALVAGDGASGMIGLRAYSADGSLDPAFGSAGSVDRASTPLAAAGMAPDGSIYTVHSAGRVTRFLADGAFDDEVTIATASLQSVGIQASGEVITGNRTPGGSPEVHRVQIGGSGLELDPGFGSAGSQVYNPPTGMGFGQSFFNRLAIGTDDRIVMTGFDEVVGNGIFVAAAAADAPAAPLYWVIALPDTGSGHDVVVDRQGRVLVVGGDGAGGAVVIRMNGPNRDALFAGDGSFSTAAGLRVIELQADGRVVAAGAQGGQWAIVRLWD